jgi:hypothetical protein
MEQAVEAVFLWSIRHHNSSVTPPDANAGVNSGALLPRFQSTTQPTKCDVLDDFRVLWQSPRFCMLL